MNAPTPIEALRALVEALQHARRIPAPCPRLAECDSYQCDVDRPLLRAYDDALALVAEDDRKRVGDALAAWGNAVKWFVYGCVAPSGAVDCHAAYININEKVDVCSFCGRSVTERPRERARRRKS